MSQIVRNGLKAVENEKVSFLGRRKHFLNSIFSDGESFERIDRSRILVFIGCRRGGSDPDRGVWTQGAERACAPHLPETSCPL